MSWSKDFLSIDTPKLNSLESILNIPFQRANWGRSKYIKTGIHVCVIVGRRLVGRSVGPLLMRFSDEPFLHIFDGLTSMRRSDDVFNPDFSFQKVVLRMKMFSCIFN